MDQRFTSREANQDLARAKRATHYGPVFITDRGRPAHVLLTIADYRRLTCHKKSLAEALSNPEVAKLDFDIPRLPDFNLQPIDFD